MVVENLFDNKPPVSNQQAVFIVVFENRSCYDPHTRFVYGPVTYRWK